MKVVNSAQMKEMDKETINDIGITGIVLMENAGLQVVNTLFNSYRDLTSKKIAVICGKGNNGGDGLVVARHLNHRGVSVEVFILTERKLLSNDAAVNFDIAKKLDIRIHEIRSIKDIDNFTSRAIKSSDIIIDAILGTGITSEITGFYREAVQLINKANKEVVAIDIPSGLSSDTGKVIGEHIVANMTISLALPKVGNVVFPSAEYSGKVKIVDIGIPKKVIEKRSISVELVEEEQVCRFFNKRKPDSHKGSYGHVLVIAGSYGKGGAAAMACMSALRAGAGLVTLAIPENMNFSFETELPEIMTFPLPQTESGSLDITARKKLLKNLKKKDAILLGPGLSTDPSTSKLVHNILLSEEITCPLILDADGLNCIAENVEILKDRPHPLIITPHPGEMARLLGVRPMDVQDDRLNIAKNFSKENNLYVILKGANTITATPKEEVFINTTGNPGIATAGSGDVLSGITAGLISQKFPLTEVLKTAVFLHGRAGDIAAEYLGEESIIATDIVKNISKAILKLKNKKMETL